MQSVLVLRKCNYISYIVPREMVRGLCGNKSVVKATRKAAKGLKAS